MPDLESRCSVTKLIVPYTGVCAEADARLIGIAERLGIQCELLPLEEKGDSFKSPVNEGVASRGSCLVINAGVFRDWTCGQLSNELVKCLTSQFSHLLVHAVTLDAFSNSLVKALSQGRFESVELCDDSRAFYSISASAREICGAFSGLSFGPINPCNDCVFRGDAAKEVARALIMIGGKPLLAAMKYGETEVLFVGSRDVIDVNQDVAELPLSDYFSQFIPQVMSLRYIFGELCWHPGNQYAAFIIDDPLLRPKYGYLDFEVLLDMMKKHNFATTIAFIPYNYRRNRDRTVQMFRNNGDRLSICFHGNDHTAAEFASSDVFRLNETLNVAERRISALTRTTGLSCSKVMVFPQEVFSVEAARMLKAHSFLCAVNAGSTPYGGKAMLTVSEVMQPALLRHGGVPLFIRRYIGKAEPQDFALNFFFGKPAIIVDHHEAFKQPEALIQTVGMINSLSAEVRWCDLETAAANSNLQRSDSTGVCQVRAYSSAITLSNDEDCPKRFLVEWDHTNDSPAVEGIVHDSMFDVPFEVDGAILRISVEIEAKSSCTYSVHYCNGQLTYGKFGCWWAFKVMLRRRLSEVRDNYISKNRLTKAFGDTVRRQLLSRLL